MLLVVSPVMTDADLLARLVDLAYLALSASTSEIGYSWRKQCHYGKNSSTARPLLMFSRDFLRNLSYRYLLLPSMSSSSLLLVHILTQQPIASAQLRFSPYCIL